VKKSIHLPVIGNGDVTTPFLAKKMMEETLCDAVMIGKGVLGNPWIFDPQKRWSMEDGRAIPPSLEERRRVIEQHYLLLRNYYGDQGAVKEVRRHVLWYTKGLPDSASFRSMILKVKEKEALFEAIHSYFDSLSRRNLCQS
jgi:tRNA-dihydrouridine synthase